MVTVAPGSTNVSRLGSCLTTLSRATSASATYSGCPTASPASPMAARACASVIPIRSGTCTCSGESSKSVGSRNAAPDDQGDQQRTEEHEQPGAAAAVVVVGRHRLGRDRRLAWRGRSRRSARRWSAGRRQRRGGGADGVSREVPLDVGAHRGRATGSGPRRAWPAPSSRWRRSPASASCRGRTAATAGSRTCW